MRNPAYLEKKILALASNIFKNAKEEYTRIKKFLNSGFINDYEFECEIAFFKDTEDIISYDTIMCCYFDENRRKGLGFKSDFDEFYESLLTLVKAELGIGYASNIPNLEHAIYRLRSYYQLVYEDFKSLKDLENYLPFLEAKALILRDKLIKTLLKKLFNKERDFINFNIELNLCVILEDGERELYFLPLDLKFLRNKELDFLRSSSKKVKHRVYKYMRSIRSNLVRRLQYLIEDCKLEEPSSVKIDAILCSIILDLEYYIHLIHLEDIK